jgi:uncharacterized repeat protein (TIGR02543 family)
MEEFDDEYRVCPFCGYVVGTQPEEAIHIRPGALLHNRYIVGKVLGYGGFGVTYIGWDGRLEQKVAIKEYLPSDFSTRMPGHSQVTVFNGDKSEQFYDGLRKFVEEAKRLAKFQNESGIVKIFDSFEENDTAYIIMEYLDGETLTKYLEREGTIPADEAVNMLIPIMKSLEAVHAEGILHRDIAPDNIFLTKDGEVKLIDFGASRYATTSHSKSLTVIIKPGYSPEEQYRSRGDQGPHTDVYALSATLYKTITGKTPPDAMERRAKYESKKKDILVKPHKIKKDLSHIYENAILNALNVRIEDRTETISSFLEELTAEKPAKRRVNKIEPLDIYEWPLWLKVILPILMVGFITFGALLGTGLIKFDSIFSEIVDVPKDFAVVPDVETLSYDEVCSIFENLEGSLNLGVSPEGTIESEYIKAGTIIIQEPMGGSYLEVNDTVVVTISSGKKVEKPVNGVATVPFVLYDTKKEAEEKLLAAGLKKPKIKKATSETIPEGMVIKQSLIAGTSVKVKDKNKNTITLTISSGPSSFKMPDLKGKNYKDAIELLKDKKLKYKIEYEETDKFEIDSVIKQSIKAGKDVKRGTLVKLTVAAKKTVKVDDVVGLSLNAAKRKLGSQGFDIAILYDYSDSVAEGNVIKQSPSAGSSQQKNGTITIRVSKGPKPDNTTSPTKPTTTKPITTKPTTTKPITTEPTTTSPTTTKPTTTQGQKVKVYFNANLGSVSPSSKEYVLGSEYGELPVPTRKGYTFNGWVTPLLTGGKITSDSPVNLTGSSNEIYLYAQWNANKYTVTLEPNGGSISKTKVTVTYDSLYSLYLPTPKKDGYTFEGWYKNPNLSGSPISLISTVKTTSDHTLYAKWKAVETTTEPTTTTTKPTTTVAPKVSISGGSSGGSSLQFTANSNISNPSYSWSSSNNSVATVSNGTVKAVGEGTAIITVIMNGKYTDSRTVKVGINWGTPYTTTTRENENSLKKCQNSYKEWQYYSVVCSSCGYYDWYGTAKCKCGGTYNNWIYTWSTKDPNSLTRYPTADGGVKSFIDYNDANNREWYWTTYAGFNANAERTVYTYVTGSYVISG